MPDVYHHEHIVTADEIDAHGHVNNLRFLHWMQSAAVAHSAAQGWSHDDYRRLGAGWVVRSHRIKYLQSAFAGDKLVVRTWVAEMKKFSSLRKYRVVRRRDDALLAAAETEWVLVDLESFDLTAVPERLAAAFVIVDET